MTSATPHADLLAALELARPIVEADLNEARSSGDADWEGQSYEALTAIDAALSATERKPQPGAENAFLDFAKKILADAPPSLYGDQIKTDVLALCTVFAGQNHSATSARQAVRMFNDIVAWKKPEPGAEGWVLVPIEPTDEMLFTTIDVHSDDIGLIQARAIYAAMLAAAPASPTKEEPDGE